jgi:hypothetical protein
MEACTMKEAQNNADRRGESANDGQGFSRRRLAAHFVDDVSNIAIAPNGACRLYFSTWSTDETGQPQRVDSELIMTLNSLRTLANALPKAIEAAEKAVDERADAI